MKKQIKHPRGTDPLSRQGAEFQEMPSPRMTSLGLALPSITNQVNEWVRAELNPSSPHHPQPNWAKKQI
jgi:hypothetical protein